MKRIIFFAIISTLNFASHSSILSSSPKKDTCNSIKKNLKKIKQPDPRPSYRNYGPVPPPEEGIMHSSEPNCGYHKTTIKKIALTKQNKDRNNKIN